MGGHSQFQPDHLLSLVIQNLCSALAPATWRSYAQIWGIYSHFSSENLHRPPLLPIDVIDMLYFVAHLCSASTIISSISALTFVHKINRLPDPAAETVVQKTLQGFGRPELVQIFSCLSLLLCWNICISELRWHLLTDIPYWYRL